MGDRRKSNDKIDRDGSDGMKPRYDDPPNSRLFIVCSENITEEEFRTAFEKYGHIEEIWFVKDRRTGEPKGITYIKFSKTSEAALALEEMNGCRVGNHTRPLKVMIAHSKEEGSKREMNEEERLLRLFCVVPKTMTDRQLRDHFKQFGDIDHVYIVKDRERKESKGFAYVKFHRVSHAAKAFEGCDRSFKAVFAEPKRQRSFIDPFDRHNAPMPPLFGGGNSSDSGYNPFSNPGSYTSLGDSFTTLRVIAPPNLNQYQLWKLFDLVPGLDYLHLDVKSRSGKGHAIAVYNNQQAAAYARDKLHGFEYPPGQRLIVKGDPAAVADLPMNTVRGIYPGSTGHALSNPVNSAGRPSLQTADLARLAETIAQASSLIQAAGLAPARSGLSFNGNNTQSGNNAVSGEQYDPLYCSVKLPPPQPFAPVDAETAVRLFIVCNSVPPPPFALNDVFGRFGNLIEVYMLNGKNYGYVKYASKESGEAAMQTLHGQEICGIRLKVMEAEQQSEDRRKRIKMDNN